MSQVPGENARDLPLLRIAYLIALVADGIILTPGIKAGNDVVIFKTKDKGYKLSLDLGVENKDTDYDIIGGFHFGLVPFFRSLKQRLRIRWRLFL